MNRIVTLCLIVFSSISVFAQPFTHGDTLRGSLSPLRTCYDVVYYHLNIKVNPADSTISGSNLFKFKVVENFKRLQFDLFENMLVDSVVYKNASLPFTREFNAVFVDFPEQVNKGGIESFKVYYHGKPIVAAKAPWDGGFVWKKDEKGRDWIGVACEGIGASLWWPNKDHLSDEPDSMQISVSVPQGLMDISNGRLRSLALDPVTGYAVFNWYVHNPINNYNVTLNIGHYVLIDESYAGLDGDLSLNYYVLDYNEDKAREHFKQVKPMMACYENYMTAYPFYDDGYKLVETPYLGMEHQSAIAYGNKYLPGYAGSDYSRIGLDFDYIIIHETGHEWWGNHVSMKDAADMWIHEGFCTYSEAIYVECMFDYTKAMEYVNAKKAYIGNQEPIIGIYGVNHEGDGDMYNKGMLMLNTLRHLIDNDTLWWDVIRGIQNEFGNKTVTTEDIVDYINAKTGTNYSYFFKQYLYYANIPTFRYEFIKKKKQLVLRNRWSVDVEDFDMPLLISVDNGSTWMFITPTTNWTDLELGMKYKKRNQFKIAEDKFYIKTKQVN